MSCNLQSSVAQAILNRLPPSYGSFAFCSAVSDTPAPSACSSFFPLTQFYLNKHIINACTSSARKITSPHPPYSPDYPENPRKRQNSEKKEQKNNNHKPMNKTQKKKKKKKKNSPMWGRG